MLGTKTIFTPTLKKMPKAVCTKGTRVADYPKGETLIVALNADSNRNARTNWRQKLCLSDK